ncbi:MAG: hypothetical protein RLZZ440_2040 [Planctomycetota bacterium]
MESSAGERGCVSSVNVRDLAGFRHPRRRGYARRRPGSVAARSGVNWKVGATHAPLPDVHFGHRALRSLGCRRRFAILASLVRIRRLRATGDPARRTWLMCQMSRQLEGRGHPCPVAGRSLRASCPSLTRMQTSLRNPCFARLHTPAPGHGRPRPGQPLCRGATPCQARGGRLVACPNPGAMFLEAMPHPRS